MKSEAINESVYLGLDIGSTTVKIVAIDEAGSTVFSKYVRHFSEVRSKTCGKPQHFYAATCAA